MNNVIYIDIETIPTQRQDVKDYFSESIADELTQALESVKAPSNYKDEAKIADYIEAAKINLKSEFAAKRDAAVNKTGLDGAFGQVVCVGMDLRDGGNPVVIRSMDEAELLRSVNDTLSDEVSASDTHSTAVVGHNVSAFDLRFLAQRYMVNGIRPHPLIARAAQAKPWESEKVYDTMIQFAGVGNRISLDKLCLALGLPGKGDITGADVWPMVQAGRLDEVAAYCADDVIKTRAVFKRMTFSS